MPTIEDLGRTMKAQFPGKFDKFTDAQVGASVKQTYPDRYNFYTDVAQTPATKTVTPPRSPEEEQFRNAVGNFAGAFYEGVKPFVDIGRGIISNDPNQNDQAREIARSMVTSGAHELLDPFLGKGRVVNELNQASDAWQHGNYGQMAYHLAGAVPLFGGQTQQVANDFQNGDYARGFGHGTFLAASMLGPKLAPKILPPLANLAELGGATIRGTATGLAKAAIRPVDILPSFHTPWVSMKQPFVGPAAVRGPLYGATAGSLLAGKIGLPPGLGGQAGAVLGLGAEVLPGAYRGAAAEIADTLARIRARRGPPPGGGGGGGGGAGAPPPGGALTRPLQVDARGARPNWTYGQRGPTVAPMPQELPAGPGDPNWTYGNPPVTVSPMPKELPSGPPMPPVKQPIITPPPADPSYVRAVPAEYAVPEGTKAPAPKTAAPEAAAPEAAAPETPAEMEPDAELLESISQAQLQKPYKSLKANDQQSVYNIGRRILNPLPVETGPPLVPPGTKPAVEIPAPELTYQSPTATPEPAATTPSPTPAAATPLPTPAAATPAVATPVETTPSEETAPTPAGAPQLPPVTKTEMNRMIHARIQNMDLPGSAAGSKAPGYASGLAKEMYPDSSYEQLTLPQMLELYNQVGRPLLGGPYSKRRGGRIVDRGYLGDLQRTSLSREATLNQLRSR